MANCGLWFGLSCYFYILFGGLIVPNNSAFKRQQRHIANIIKSNELNILQSESDDYLPMHNYQLCPLLHKFIWSNRVFPKNQPIYQVEPYMVSHDFTKYELSIITREYLDKIYNSDNFPLTYREHVFVNIDNSTANEMYYGVCKDYYTGEPSPIMPVLFSIGMIVTIMLHIGGIV
jgi:hypothetical protein